MAATVQIVRKTSSGPIVSTDITAINTRANAEDTHTVAGTTNPIRIPAAGTNYSYWVTTRLNVTVAPAGTIDSLRWFTDGANGFGTGVTAKGAKASTGADAGYRIATGTPGTTGTQLLQANHSGLDEAPADVFGFTSGAPKTLTGTISNPTTGQFGDHWVYQIEVGTTAGPGATAQETWTWRFDET
jgi:hypothetical protein